eukprot:s2527_g2.t1
MERDLEEWKIGAPRGSTMSRLEIIAEDNESMTLSYQAHDFAPPQVPRAFTAPLPETTTDCTLPSEISEALASEGSC